MLSADRRFGHYLANLPQIEQGQFAPRAGTMGVLVRSGEEKQEALGKIAAIYPGLTPEDRDTELLYEYYVVPILDSMARLGREGSCIVFVGDNDASPLVPSLVKSRPAGYIANGILARLDADRHFGPVESVRDCDRGWFRKRPKLVWRGVTTGCFNDAKRGRRRSSRSYLPDAVERVSNTNIDIGFTRIVSMDDGHSDVSLSRLNDCIKPKLQIREQVRAKYLLSLEGNDVASGLKWMLASNSVVLMPKPTCESWACESLLEPMRHYVPVAHDLSDLEEVFAWCTENDASCQEIAKEGQSFIAAFDDPSVERRLADGVVAEYLNRVTLS